MGGPWRERGFDPAALPRFRPPSGRRTETVARESAQDGLVKIVLVYIAAVVTSFGVMLSLFQQGW